MRFGQLTLISANASYSAGLAELTFEPMVSRRYLILRIDAVGPAADAGDRNLITSIRDTRRDTDYILGGGSAASRESNNRGVALRDLAGVNGAQAPRWRGSFDELKRTIAAYAKSQEEVAFALKQVQELFGELVPEVAAIPLDGDLKIRVKDMASGDTPSSMSLLVMYLGEATDGFGVNVPALNRPFWQSFTRLSIGTSAQNSQELKERLAVASAHYAGGRLRHRSTLGSLFVASSYALNADDRTKVRLSTGIGSCRSIFEPEYAPISLVANPSNPLPLMHDGVLDGDEVGYRWEQDALSAAAYLHLANQYVTER